MLRYQNASDCEYFSRHCARYIYVVPDGLKELMTDISREVIRSHPENIYTFIADYLDALLITRENARVAARLVQSITEIADTTVEFLVKTGMHRPQVDKVVKIIQRSFKKHIQKPTLSEMVEMADEVEEVNIVTDIIDQAEIPPEIGEEAAKIIQNAYRKFKARRDKEKELLSGMVDWRVAARSAIRLYRKTGVTHEEANKAATLIKAAYKGYYTRRIMRKLADENRELEYGCEEEEFEDEVSDHEYDQKFVTIDYGSIIPHVDFDESKLTEEDPNAASLSVQESIEKEKSTTDIAIVYSITEEILDLTFQKIKEIEIDSSEKEVTVKKYEQLHQEVQNAETSTEKESEATSTPVAVKIDDELPPESGIKESDEVDRADQPPQGKDEQTIEDKAMIQGDTEIAQTETENEVIQEQPAVSE